MDEQRVDIVPSPWHEGERRLQQRAGVAERMAVFGRKVIRDFLPEQHRVFYGQLPLLLVGAVDPAGDPWASVLEGQPGFIDSPDPRLLAIRARPTAGDPLANALEAGAAVGLLGIELHTRRRNRLNGTVAATDAHGYSVAVGHAFGNCPQYIQTRDYSFARDPASAAPTAIESGTSLDAAGRAAIAAADTFFIASYLDSEGERARRGVDVSHRGGKAGFVRIDGDTLTIPDFAGNLHFNTLGNLLLNPRAGLLFIDFASGDLLQLTGSTEIVFDGDEVRSFQGAERLWRFTVRAWVRRRGALALRFAFGEWSPNSLLTGSWDQASARRAAESLRSRWRPFRIARVVEESAVVRSFHLEPADGAGLPLFAAGQHLPLRIGLPGHERPLLRNYTISAAPSDDLLRISVKREGLVSSWLHAHGTEGTAIEVRAPEGDFGIDPTIRRPAVLLSAGIGITPMLAMLRQLVYEGQRTRRMRPTWFVHGARNLAERPFDRELAELAGRAGRSLGIMRALSQPGPDATRGVDYEVEGRVDVALLKSFLPLDDYDFFLCGPAPFMQSLYDGLRALRIADDRIHAEAFGPSSLRRRPDAATAAVPVAQPATEPVPVIFAESAKEARWEPGGGTLLELAESRGLAPEYSCRGGSCGTCRTKLLEGEVAYPTAPSASRIEGTALVCCAVPAAGSARVVLAL